MNRKIFIFMLSISILIGGVPFYVYHKYYKGAFSITNQDWGNFGSFIGGTTGALLSTLSLLVLIYTLHITIKNSKEQLSNQQLNHDAQMKLQKDIHNQERDLTRFSMNIQLLNNYIDILNKKLDVKKYKIFIPLRQTYSSAPELATLNRLFTLLQSELLHNPDASLQSPYKIIVDSKITYIEELVPISNIIGIISNEENERFRANYISIFLAGTHRERTYWLLCHVINYSDEARLAALANPSLLVLPENLLDLFKRHHKLA